MGSGMGRSHQHSQIEPNHFSGVAWIRGSWIHPLVALGHIPGLGHSVSFRAAFSSCIAGQREHSPKPFQILFSPCPRPRKDWPRRPQQPRLSSACCCASWRSHIYIHPIITICTARGICWEWVDSICWCNFLGGICIDHFFMQSFCIDHFLPIFFFLIQLNNFREGRGLCWESGHWQRPQLLEQVAAVSPPFSAWNRELRLLQGGISQIFIVFCYTWGGNSSLMC